MFDYHLHSRNSFDAKLPPLEIARISAARGFREICLTEHADIVPIPEIEGGTLDYAAYTADVARWQEDYPIPVKKGLELGVTEETAARAEAFLEGKSFDFIICSQHWAGHEDPAWPRYFTGRTQQQAYAFYLEEVLRTVKRFKSYSVLGHLGYVSRYAPWPSERGLRHSDFQDLIDEILRVIIADGRGIEVNTGGIRYKTGDTLPGLDIVRRYLALGGEILTVGSDAHRAEDIGIDVAAVLERLKAINARYICTFSEMKPTFHPLDR